MTARSIGEIIRPIISRALRNMPAADHLAEMGSAAERADLICALLDLGGITPGRGCRSSPSLPQGMERGCMSWIKLYRGWSDNDVFASEKLTEREAWLWLIENAAWKAMTRRGGKGNLIAIQRGQLHVSDRSLASAWGWDKKHIRRFLARLETRSMLDRQGDRSGTVLTIVNYNKYQDIAIERDQPGDHEKDQRGTTQEERKENLLSEGRFRAANSGFPDPAKVMFDSGIALLTSKGKSRDQAAKIIAGFQRDFGDAAVIDAISKSQRATEPVGMMRKLLGNSKKQEEYLGV